MATSPMRPQLRKKQTWGENKENKPSPLIEVPPFGPTPMFANSNVSVVDIYIFFFINIIINNHLNIVMINRLT